MKASIPIASITRHGVEVKLDPNSGAEGQASLHLAHGKGADHIGIISNLEAPDLRMLLDTLGWALGYPLGQRLSEALFRLGPWAELLPHSPPPPSGARPDDPGKVQREHERSLIELRVTHVLTLFEGGLIGSELDDEAKEFLVKTLRFIVAGGV